MRINQASVLRLNVPVGKSEVIEFDDELKGFGIRVRAGGKRTWIAQYRIGKKQRRVTLGTPEALPADKARKAAQTILAKVHLGADPQAEKIEARAQATGTLGAIADRFLEHAKKRLRPRSYDEIERHLTKHWAPLEELSVNRISRANIATRIDEIAKESGPVAANRARSALSAFYSWAMRAGLAETNPVIGTNKEAEHPRDRVLTDAELVEIWNGCREDDYGRIVRLLILTGQRREEVGGISDAEIDLKNRVWHLPRERTKNGKPHDVPLSDMVLDILHKAPRRAGRDLIFGEGEGAFAGWSRAKAALDERTAASRTKATKSLPWRLHDIRRTVATRMADIGTLPHVIEAVLNHASGHKAGVAGVYNLAVYAAEKRQALDMWAGHVAALVAGDRSNIVPLTGGRKVPA